MGIRGSELIVAVESCKWSGQSRTPDCSWITEVFVWKEKSVEATAELLHEFEKLASDVAELLAR